ncbi:Acg family FMN-binding oxidoreductase [Halalkalibaculum roseum]|nr:hypothetical protein [Halalkalibaculum roseum]
MKKSIDYEKLISYGVRAPSGHNTQPWLFSIESDEIHIHPDLTRTLPVVDGDNHALYISLGCAAENIILAASKVGLSGDVSISESHDEATYLKISLSPDVAIEKDELFDFINRRQSTRNEYLQKQVPTEDLDALKESFELDGISMLTFTESKDFDTLQPLIIEGSNNQFKNNRFVEELVNWFRFSKSEAEERGDGLWTQCMGLPNMPSFIGNIVMKYFVSANSEAKRWKKLIGATAGFALFIAEKHDILHWVRLGRAFQRFGLTATKLGISHAHVNMPCEEPEVRQKLISELNLDPGFPLLLIRFGYSEKMPFSFRRSVNEVLINRKQETYV